MYLRDPQVYMLIDVPTTFPQLLIAMHAGANVYSLYQTISVVPMPPHWTMGHRDDAYE